MDKRVDIDDVAKLRKLFKDKSWNDYTNEDSVFTGFCDLLNCLTEVQKDLIYTLTDLYLWMPSSEYGEQLNELFNDIKNKNLLAQCKKIFLIPIVKIADRHKIKSADHCIYLASTLFRLNRNFRNISVEIFEDFEKIKANPFTNTGEEVLLFIDDFIGTGDTFIEGWNDLTSNNNTITINNSFVVTVAIQNVGLNLLRNDKKLKVFLSKIIPKGISENFNGQDILHKTEIMESIENKFFKRGKYTFGYKKSEALVTMSKTPNNTFPIFWKKYKIKDEIYYPPFLR